MSFLGDTFKFENFRMGHMWDEIKHHPQRLLFGGMMDPLSTWIENKTTGSHFTPQSDQLGGAYGGRTISAFGGGQQGGIYKQAQDAGIPTGQAMKFENAAHIAAGLAGAAYGGAALGGSGLGTSWGFSGGLGSGSGAGAGLTEFGTGAGQDASLTALRGGAASSPSWLNFLKAGNAGMPQNQSPQQQFQDPAIDAERRHQRVLELLVQLHQSQQAPQ